MSKSKYVKRSDIWEYYSVDYNDSYTEEMDTEGLRVLKWSMFDSPDKLGSGKMFMESPPVHILDQVYKENRVKGFIEIGYLSKSVADRMSIASQHPYRLGKGVKLRCKNPTVRMKIVRGLIQYGIERIHIYNESIYFDTDNYIRKPELLTFL
ncbi:MAG: hypothetical protein HRU18_11230 [Pseudoalteromonas sp.]|uniref:hypothetical protein n=1 Tax=Pseudoalteromonas sp. TaxID=53249 RepID=UPI001D9EB56B|nr:hypothetical protein [Pseudoalteromonas sp.]NRA78772.1 hypothetical protein [Pseudoalteromonas sp.]